MSVFGGSLAAMTADEAAVAETLTRQRGVLSRAQAFAMGITANGLRHRIRPGGPWQRLLPGVYLALTGQPTREQLEVAALLYAGSGSAITGAAALRRYFVEAPDMGTVDVLVPAGRQPGSRGFAVIHRTRRMPPVVAINGAISFVFPARAVADTVKSLHRLADARAVVASAVHQRRCTVADLAVELRSRPGGGSELLRTVLAEVADGIRSAPEADFRELIRKTELPLPLFNPRLYLNGKFLAEPDAWWPQAGVAAEVDSHRWHAAPEDRERTMARHARLAAAGLIVLHFSPHQLSTEPGRVLRDLAGALRAGRPVPGIITRPAAE
jgi:hypothetical protein